MELPRCPKCAEPLPKNRKPTSVRQAALGGWTCSNCGCEMDKLGAEIRHGAPGAAAAPKLVEGQEIPFKLDPGGKSPLELAISEGEKEE